MGILPEIDRVYITMNQRLYLWDYIEGGSNSFETYEKGDEILTHVALVPARRGVFVDSISHVLVLCRQTTISLVGIAATPGPASAGINRRRELEMFETDIAVPTANQEMLSVVGTPEGRILMCGANDGAIFELEYGSAEGWLWGGKAGLKQRTGTGMGNLLPSLFASNTSGEISATLMEIHTLIPCGADRPDNEPYFRQKSTMPLRPNEHLHHHPLPSSTLPTHVRPRGYTSRKHRWTRPDAVSRLESSRFQGFPHHRYLRARLV